MSASRAEILAGLRAFLRVIQKPNRPVESVGEYERLVASGLIDSLAIVQIVMYLESTYGIDFAGSGIDPERLATIASITDLIEEHRA